MHNIGLSAHLAHRYGLEKDNAHATLLMTPENTAFTQSIVLRLHSLIMT